MLPMSRLAATINREMINVQVASRMGMGWSVNKVTKVRFLGIKKKWIKYTSNVRRPIYWSVRPNTFSLLKLF